MTKQEEIELLAYDLIMNSLIDDKHTWKKRVDRQTGYTDVKWVSRTYKSDNDEYVKFACKRNGKCLVVLNNTVRHTISAPINIFSKRDRKLYSAIRAMKKDVQKRNNNKYDKYLLDTLYGLIKD